MLTVASLLALALPAGPGQPAPAAFAGPTGRTRVTAWSYAPEAASTAGWPQGRFPARRITVPHVANPRADDLRTTQARFRGGAGWYRTTLTVGGGRYELGFDSVSHRADVFVDGRPVASHAGAFQPFRVRVALAPGRHTLVVRADWRSPRRQSDEGWHRTWFNFGGLHREVTLRRVGASSVQQAWVTTTRIDARRARVVVRASVVNERDRPRRIGALGRLGAGPLFALPPKTIAAGAAATLQTRVRVRSDQLWSPDRPRLHELRVGVVGESSYAARVGLREITTAGGVLRINGVRTTLRGASLHEDVPGRGDALTARDLDATVRQLRRLGANATRAQHALAPALLERLDRAGIMVWQHAGPVDSPGEWRAGTDPDKLAAASRRVRLDVRAQRHHPAIVGWDLGIETAFDGRPGQAEHVTQNARWIHAADPGRPVSVDVWAGMLPTPGSPLIRELDAIGATNYLGWFERTFDTRPAIRAAIERRLAAYRRVAGPDRLLLVTEFGAEGSPLNPGLGGRSRQAQILADHLAVYAATPGLDGALAWALRDFAVNPAFGGGSIQRKDRSIRFVRGLNQKGLFDVAGRPKPAARAVREGLAGLRP